MKEVKRARKKEVPTNYRSGIPSLASPHPEAMDELPNTERIACINFQELGAFLANILINAIYKYNYYTYILLKMCQTILYLRLK